MDLEDDFEDDLLLLFVISLAISLFLSQMDTQFLNNAIAAYIKAKLPQMNKTLIMCLFALKLQLFYQLTLWSIQMIDVPIHPFPLQTPIFW